MGERQVELTGTLRDDGTLVLDGKPGLPAGRVRVVVQTLHQEAPKEDWFECLLRIRARREAEGYKFMTEEEMNAHIAWLRDEEDRIDRIHREMEQERLRQDPS